MKTITTHKTVVAAVAVLAALALPMVAGAAGDKLIVQDGNIKVQSAGVDKMVVTDQGFVGVGTNAPLNAILAKGNSYTTTQIISHYTGAEPSVSGGFIAKKNNVSTTNGGLPVSGDRIGYMLFGSVGTDNFDKNAAGFGAYAESAWTNTSFPAYFAIETAAPSSVRTEKMRITGNGNVGIGSKLPNSKLEVNGGVRVYPVSASANTETPTAVAKPACNASTRGTIWFTPSVTDDVLEVCAKIGGSYAFKTITLAP